MNLRAVLRSQSGFTVIEMLTVFAVISILSALIILNTQVGDRRQQLRDAAARYVNAARNVEARASSSETVKHLADGGDVEPTSRKAYGVCITTTDATGWPNSRCAEPGGNANAYQLYARKTSDTNLAQRPTDPDILESVALPGGFVFTTPNVYLDYVPPAPTLLANGSLSDTDVIIQWTESSGECSSSADCREIKIRPRAGALYVE